MKYFHCPVNDWNCPYYKDRANIEGKKAYGICTLENPYEECDDFYATHGDDCDPKDYTDNTND